MRLADIDPNRLIGFSQTEVPQVSAAPQIDPNAVAPINTSQSISGISQTARQASVDSVRGASARADLQNQSNVAADRALQQSTAAAADLGRSIAQSTIDRSGWITGINAIGETIGSILASQGEQNYDAQYVNAYVRAQNWIMGVGEFEGGGLRYYMENPEGVNLSAAAAERDRLIVEAGLPPDMAHDLARVYAEPMMAVYRNQISAAETALQQQQDAEARVLSGRLNVALANSQRWAYNPSSDEFQASRVQVRDILSELYTKGIEPGNEAYFMAWEAGVMQQTELLFQVEEDAREDSEELQNTAEFLSVSVGVANIWRNGRAEGKTEFEINNQVNDYILDRATSDGNDAISLSNPELRPFLNQLANDPGDPLSQMNQRQAEEQEFLDHEVTVAEAEYIAENPQEAYEAGAGYVIRNMRNLLNLTDAQALNEIENITVNGINVFANNREGALELNSLVADTRRVQERITNFNDEYGELRNRERTEERRFSDTLSGLRNANSVSSIQEITSRFIESGNEGESRPFQESWNSLSPEQQQVVWDETREQFDVADSVPMPGSRVGVQLMGDEQDPDRVRAQAIAVAYSHLWEARQNRLNHVRDLDAYVQDRVATWEQRGLGLFTVGDIEGPAISIPSVERLISGSSERRRQLIQERTAAIQRVEEQGRQLRDLTRSGPGLSFGNGTPSARVSGAPTGRPGTYAVPFPQGTNAWISSTVGPRGGRNHNGLDLAANEGTQVISYLDGTVVFSGYEEGGFGNYVTIRDDTGNTHTFAHLQYNPRLSVGSEVQQGQRLGLVGNTGLSSGPHLHWEIRAPGGAVIDPLEYSGDASPPGTRSLTSPEFSPTSSDVNGIPSGEGEVLQDGVLYTADGDVKVDAFTAEEPYEWDLASGNPASYEDRSTSNYGYRVIDENDYLRETIYDSSRQMGVPTQWLADWLAVR